MYKPCWWGHLGPGGLTITMGYENHRTPFTPLGISIDSKYFVSGDLGIIYGFPKKRNAFLKNPGMSQGSGNTLIKFPTLGIGLEPSCSIGMGLDS